MPSDGAGSSRPRSSGTSTFTVSTLVMSLLQIGVGPRADDSRGPGGLVLAGQQVVGAFEGDEAARVPGGTEDVAGVFDADGVVGGGVHHQQRAAQGADALAKVGGADVL